MISALGLVFFGLLLFVVAAPSERLVVGLYIAAVWAAIFYVFVASLYARAPLELAGNDRIATVLLSFVLVLALCFVLIETDVATVIGLVLMILVPLWSAYHWSAIRLIVPYGATIWMRGARQSG